MGKSSYLTGMPWHVEKYVRQEDDPRRHRSRCLNYSKNTKFCVFMRGQCIGAAHCLHYKEKQEEYLDLEKHETASSLKFEGVKEIPLCQIEIDHSRAEEPKPSKVTELITYYRQNGSLDKPIIVSVKGQGYYLEDKYLRYYVAKLLGLSKVPAKIGTFKKSKLEDKLRKKGARVKHKKFGMGIVLESDCTHITIQFDNNRIKKLDIAACLTNGLITLN